MATDTHQTGIHVLPPELLGLIQEYLPLYDAIRLGLCSRQLRKNTEPKLWEQARCNIEYEKFGGIKYVGRCSDDERWLFLKEIEPNIPKLELCHYCRIFHSKLGDHSLWRPINTDIHQDFDCDTKEVQFRRWDIDWGFGFRDVYATMMRHALSPEHGVALSDMCISTDWTFAQAYKNLHNARRSPFKRFVSYKKLDTEAVIQNNHLLVHRIQRLWMPIHLQGTDVLVRYGAGDIAGDFKICMHHGPQSGEMINNFTIPLRENIKYVLAARRLSGSEEDGPLPYIIKRCEDCPTEYAISCHVHDDNSVEVVLDVWQNLGDCESPQAPGWLNCWGMLNIRLCEAPDDTARGAWHQSGVGYVGDATMFPTPAGQSGINHPSARSVSQQWSQVQKQTAVSLQALDVVPQLSVHHFKKIRSSIIEARYEPNPRPSHALPPFRHEFTGNDGHPVYKWNLRYTRTVYTG